MAGGIDWFRWHHGSVTDPKFQLVAKKADARLGDVITVWAFVLEKASADADRGTIGEMDFETLDYLLGADEGTAVRILGAMTARGLIEGSRIAQWDKRQPKRERDDPTAADRQRAKRERDAAQVTDQVNVTPCHATSRQQKPREEESREEEKEEQTQPSATAAGAVCVLLRSKRIATVNPGHLGLKALLDAGADIGAFAAAADIALKANRPSFEYVLGIVKRQAEEAARMAEEGLKAAPSPKASGPPITVPSDAAERTAAELARQQAHQATRPPTDVRAKLAEVAKQLKATA